MFRHFKHFLKFFIRTKFVHLIWLLSNRILKLLKFKKTSTRSEALIIKKLFTRKQISLCFFFNNGEEQTFEIRSKLQNITEY